MSERAQWRRAAAPGEVPPGGRKLVRVGERPVLLLRLEDGWAACDARCPHRQLPLEHGTLLDGILTCPHHHFRYDVRTGENVYPANVYPQDLEYLQAQLAPLTLFPVEEREDGVWIQLPALSERDP